MIYDTSNGIYAALEAAATRLLKEHDLGYAPQDVVDAVLRQPEMREWAKQTQDRLDDAARPAENGFNTGDEVQAFDDWRDENYSPEDSKYDLMSKAWKAGRSYAIHKMPDFGNEDKDVTSESEIDPRHYDFEDRRLREQALVLAVQNATVSPSHTVETAEKYLAFLKGDGNGTA